MTCELKSADIASAHRSIFSISLSPGRVPIFAYAHSVLATFCELNEETYNYYVTIAKIL